VPCTKVFPGPVSVKVEVVIVPKFIAWLKFAVTAEVIPTSVDPFVGVTVVTVGGGVAGFTVTLTEPATVLSSLASVGVKVAPSLVVPVDGAVPGVVQEKPPGTDAVPLLSIEEASVWPYVMALAVGHAVTVGVALLTTTPTEPLTVL